jgi:hypothetical protein
LKERSKNLFSVMDHNTEFDFALWANAQKLVCALGHNEKFSYVLWAISQSLVMLYGLQYRNKTEKYTKDSPVRN